ncbi:MAG: hypothetical protein N2234_10780, partial [Planctomycetota bacterium]|nr:hypothetical protein [Planctomycetota bacterium]
MKRFLLVSVLFFFAFGAIYAAYNPFEMEPRKDSDAAKLKRENEQLRRQVEALKKQVEGLKRRLESPREPQREPFPHQSEHLRRQPQERQEVDRDWFRRSMEQRQMLRKLEWLRDNFRRLNDAQRERVLKMLKEKMGPERAKEFLKRIE